jgi:hypothetical protein
MCDIRTDGRTDGGRVIRKGIYDTLQAIRREAEYIFTYIYVIYMSLFVPVLKHITVQAVDIKYSNEASYRQTKPYGRLSYTNARKGTERRYL